MRLHLQRSGGFTGDTLRWQVDTEDTAAWQALLDRTGLRFHGASAWLRWLLVPLAWVPGTAHNDYLYRLSVDGRTARFRGVDVSGPVAELVTRITTEGAEIRSR